MARPSLIASLRLLTMIGVLCLLSGACQSARPEAKLARHLNALSEIMETHRDDPKAGIEALRGYLHRDLPEIMAQSAEVVLMLQRIDNDERRLKRARRLHKVLGEPLRDFVRHEAVFRRAIRQDPEARQALADVIAPLRRILPREEALRRALPRGIRASKRR